MKNPFFINISTLNRGSFFYHLLRTSKLISCYHQTSLCFCKVKFISSWSISIRTFVDQWIGVSLLYANAGMLQLRLSLQSNPSILTGGLLPKLGRTQPPPAPPPPVFLDEDGESKSCTGDNGDSVVMILSSPKRESCINGLATLLGGDPQKNGGDDANTCVQDCSIPSKPPFGSMMSKRSDPAVGSKTSDWWLRFHLRERTGWGSLMVEWRRPRRRGLGQTT